MAKLALYNGTANSLVINFKDPRSGLITRRDIRALCVLGIDGEIFTGSQDECNAIAALYPDYLDSSKAIHWLFDGDKKASPDDLLNSNQASEEATQAVGKKALVDSVAEIGRDLPPNSEAILQSVEEKMKHPNDDNAGVIARAKK